MRDKGEWGRKRRSRKRDEETEGRVLIKVGKEKIINEQKKGERKYSYLKPEPCETL